MNSTSGPLPQSAVTSGRPCFSYPPNFYWSAMGSNSNRRAAARSRSFQATRSRQWSGMAFQAVEGAGELPRHCCYRIGVVGQVGREQHRAAEVSGARRLTRWRLRACEQRTHWSESYPVSVLASCRL